MNKINEYCYAGALSFRRLDMTPRQLLTTPLAYMTEDMRVPQGCTIGPDGNVSFCLYYPNAKSVRLQVLGEEPVCLTLIREKDLWLGSCKPGTGLLAVIVIVDGNEVLSPALPIGYGYNRPVNLVEVPENDNVITPRSCPHGSVVMDFFESEVSGKLERIYVYLPPDYMMSDKCYPVLYLQHGHGENETTWVTQGRMNFIADNLIGEGKAVPSIVVMCNGMMTFEEEGGVRLGYAESFSRMLTEEVIPYIDQRYRTLPDAGHRAMAGLSMGSIQTSIISLNHPELFSYIWLFSGFVQDPLTGYTGHLSSEKLRNYKDRFKVYFRGIGDKDIFFRFFLSDDELLERQAISSDRRIYEGGHEWRVWQHCFHDFYQLLFTDHDCVHKAAEESVAFWTA